MNTPQKKNESLPSKYFLLSPQEFTICQQISSHKSPHSQRAVALLALNNKLTQFQAAEKAGLSVGQVKYWVGKYRKQRLSIFPQSLLDNLNSASKSEPDTKIALTGGAASETAGLMIKKSKAKKGVIAEIKPKKSKAKKRKRKMKDKKKKKKSKAKKEKKKKSGKGKKKK